MVRAQRSQHRENEPTAVRSGAESELRETRPAAERKTKKKFVQKKKQEKTVRAKIDETLLAVQNNKLGGDTKSQRN